MFTCERCKTEKATTEFKKNRYSFHGHDIICKCCRKAEKAELPVGRTEFAPYVVNGKLIQRKLVNNKWIDVELTVI
jgi:hypothetical protein